MSDFRQKEEWVALSAFAASQLPSASNNSHAKCHVWALHNLIPSSLYCGQGRWNRLHLESNIGQRLDKEREKKSGPREQKS